MTDFDIVADVDATNSDAETQTDIDLFDDAGFEETDDNAVETETGTEDTNQTEEKVEETNQQETKETKYFLKHPKKGGEYTLEESLALAQKGLDYDFIRQGYNDYKQMFDELIGDTGMTPQDFVSEYRKEMQELKVRERANEILENELVSEEFALRLARAEIGNEKAIKEEESARNAITQQEQAEEMEKQQALEDIKLLMSLRPELSEPNFQIPQEVIQMVQTNNIPLSTAYLNWVSQQNEVKIQQLEQTQKNKETSMGSMKSTGGREPDDFIKALFSD